MTDQSHEMSGRNLKDTTLSHQQPAAQVAHRIPYRQKTYSQYSKENEHHVFPVYTDGIGIDNKAVGCS